MANNVDIGCGDSGIEFVSEATVVFKSVGYTAYGYNIAAYMNSDGLYLFCGYASADGHTPFLNMVTKYNNTNHFIHSFGFNDTNTFATIHGVSYGSQIGASYSNYYNVVCYYDIFIYQNGTITSLIDGWTDTTLIVYGLSNCALIKLGGA